jgi:diguanylate cyclase (GGDEF)-like protein/PAS domain S-box-containing protein
VENKQTRTVLLIDDRSEEPSAIRTTLEQMGPGVFQVSCVESIGDAEGRLSRNSVDIVLLDLGVPESNSLEAVRLVQIKAPHAAIVVVCDSDNEPTAIQAIQQGAQDYLIKGQIEPRTLKRSLFNAVDRKALEDIQLVEKERAQVTLDCIGDAVICTDLQGNITFMNRVAETMTGWQLKHAAGRAMTNCVRIVDAVTRIVILDPMEKAASQNQTGSLPLNCILIRRDGREVSIEDSVAPIHNRDGQVTGAVIVFRDVSATRALERQLTNSAQHDFLTGLPNRMLLSDRIGQAIALAHRKKGHAAVLFLDLDGFKHVNDSHGHLIGDKVLQSVAKRLLACVRSPDTVVRQGGDEFIVLLQELKHAQDAVFTVARLLKTVADVHYVESHEIRITTSIGISVYPSDGLDGQTLIRHADMAMYYAKKNGSQNYRFFRPEMAREAVEVQPDGQDIWHSLDWFEFKPALQTAQLPDANNAAN